MLSLKNISIITVTFNSEQIIERFINQVELIEFDYKKIIIVDNNSNDKTLEKIQNTGKKCQIISNRSNFGYGKAVNIGMKMVKTKYCLIVNPDLIFEKNFFTNLLGGVNRNHGFGIIAPILLNTYKKEKNKTSDTVVNFVSGACFLIDYSILKNKVFDENIFLFYEDNILSNKLISLGFQLILLGDCHVIHEGENSTTKNTNIEKLRNWHMGWSEAYFITKGRRVLNKKIALNLFTKIRRALIFLMFFKIKRFNSLYFRIRGFFCFFQGVDCHERRDVGPF